LPEKFFGRRQIAFAGDLLRLFDQLFIIKAACFGHVLTGHNRNKQQAGCQTDPRKTEKPL